MLLLLFRAREALTVKRRDFITLLGGATAAWPFAARAQQPMPVIGFLSSLSEPQTTHLVMALVRGLSEAGLVAGQSTTIDRHFAEGQYDRLPAFADEFVRQRVSLIVAAGPPAALAAKAATPTIPIVFIVGFDPVADGLVASFSRPGGNATGIFLVTALVGQKRLEILRELNPKASAVALLVNPVSPDSPPEIKDVEAAAQANRISIKHFNASTPAEIDAAFTSITAQRPDGLLGGNATGVSLLTTELGPKRLGLLRELLPRPGPIAFVVNPNSAATAFQIQEMQEAAQAVGQPLLIVSVGTEDEVDKAFAGMAERNVAAILYGATLFFQVIGERLVALAARYRLPALYEWREFVTAGGLMSYSTDRNEVGRGAGSYAGRILKGEKPADLPVLQSSRFELVINLKTAKSLGLTAPDKLLVAADEVIE